jgi:hypothetical protein
LVRRSDIDTSDILHKKRNSCKNRSRHLNQLHVEKGSDRVRSVLLLEQSYEVAYFPIIFRQNLFQGGEFGFVEAK